MRSSKRLLMEAVSCIGETPEGALQRCRIRPSPYPLYVALVLFFFSYSISNQLVSESVIYNKVCYDHFANASLCSNVTFSKNHPALQQEAATWSIYIAAIQILPAVAVNLLLSSYCDRVGHRLPLSLSASSIILTSGWLAILATPSLYYLPTSLMFVYGALNGVCGANPLMIMSSYSYITKVSEKHNLPIAMAALEGAIELGLLAGSLASGPIADHFGLCNLAYLNIGLSIAPLLIVLFLTKELTRSRRRVQGSWKDNFSLKHIFEAFYCIFRKRKSYNRLLINLCYVAVYAVSIACAGYTALSFLYFVKEIGMTLTELSVFSGYLMAVKGLGGPIILAIAKRLRANNMTLAVTSCAVVAFAYIITSISKIPHSIWVGGALLAFQSVVYALVRTFQVSLVKEDEVGKIFAYDGIFQVIFYLLTAMFYKALYSLSVLAWPSLFLTVCAGLCLFSMVIIVCISRLEHSAVGSSEDTEADQTISS